MISVSTEGTDLVVLADEEDLPVTPLRLAEAVANADATNFLRFANEGAPVSFGNSYAEIQMVMLLPDVDADEHTVGIGQMECDALNATLEASVAVLPYEGED